MIWGLTPFVFCNIELTLPALLISWFVATRTCFQLRKLTTGLTQWHPPWPSEQKEKQIQCSYQRKRKEMLMESIHDHGLLYQPSNSSISSSLYLWFASCGFMLEWNLYKESELSVYTSWSTEPTYYIILCICNLDIWALYHI